MKTAAQALELMRERGWEDYFHAPCSNCAWVLGTVHNCSLNMLCIAFSLCHFILYFLVASLIDFIVFSIYFDMQLVQACIY